jgi:hypothetical protein
MGTFWSAPVLYIILRRASQSAAVATVWNIHIAYSQEV